MPVLPVEPAAITSCPLLHSKCLTLTAPGHDTAITYVGLADAATRRELTVSLFPPSLVQITKNSTLKKMMKNKKQKKLLRKADTN